MAEREPFRRVNPEEFRRAIGAEPAAPDLSALWGLVDGWRYDVEVLRDAAPATVANACIAIAIQQKAAELEEQLDRLGIPRPEGQ